MIGAMRAHWPEYLIEGTLLGFFMVSACVSVALIEHPGSPIRRRVRSALARRGLIGVAMGVTALVLITSPWGARSGAHMNPATTLAFWLLGKVAAADARRQGGRCLQLGHRLRRRGRREALLEDALGGDASRD